MNLKALYPNFVIYECFAFGQACQMQLCQTMLDHKQPDLAKKFQHWQYCI